MTKLPYDGAMAEFYNLTTIAGNGTAGFEDSAAGRPLFNSPRGVAVVPCQASALPESSPLDLHGNISNSSVGASSTPAPLESPTGSPQTHH